MSGTHINPDHFLQTDAGRVITPELNAEAWRLSYQAFDAALLHSTESTTLYVLVGPQGSGKSTWARKVVRDDGRAIVFDAILVKASEREPLLRAAGAYPISRIAVWFRTPLETCLTRNAARPQDEVVPERAVRNVHAAVERPTLEEGFHRIIEVFPALPAVSSAKILPSGK